MSTNTPTTCNKCPEGFEASGFMGSTKICPHCGILLKPKEDK